MSHHTATHNMVLRVSSPAFAEDGEIPVKYTFDGQNINPPLEVRGFPQDTASLAIVVEDPDAPIPPWTHWLAWNIPVKHHIKEHYITDLHGVNDFGTVSYRGPCPPVGTHRYYFRIYALDKMLDLEAGANRSELDSAMAGHILATGQLAASYTKQ